MELKFGIGRSSLQGRQNLLARARGLAWIGGRVPNVFARNTAAPELSMTVKGQEFPAYDPRGIQGMGLAYATPIVAPATCAATRFRPRFWEFPRRRTHLTTAGKPGLVKAFQDATAAVDSAGLCVFTTFAWTMDDIAPQVDGACEGDWYRPDDGSGRADLESGAGFQWKRVSQLPTIICLLVCPRKAQVRTSRGSGQRAGPDVAGVLSVAWL